MNEIVKSTESHQIVKSTELQRNNCKLIKKKELPDDELELINKFTLEPLTKDDIFTFSIELCSNEIDRDNESFTKSTIEQLAPMFVGKTGIFNHHVDARNQTARIYKTSVKQTEKLTKFSEPRISLQAKAYTINCAEFKSFIKKINGGILKEISISCQIQNKICSICGKEFNCCNHEKGKIYNNKICFIKLVNPIDAFEWSFVPIPAQPCAKTIKNFNLQTQETLNNAHIGQLQKSKLCKQIEKLGFLCGFDENKNLYFKNIVKKLNFDELQNIKSDLENILKNSNFNSSLTTHKKNETLNKTQFSEYLI